MPIVKVYGLRGDAEHLRSFRDQLKGTVAGVQAFCLKRNQVSVLLLAEIAPPDETVIIHYFCCLRYLTKLSFYVIVFCHEESARTSWQRTLKAKQSLQKNRGSRDKYYTAINRYGRKILVLWHGATVTYGESQGRTTMKTNDSNSGLWVPTITSHTMHAGRVRPVSSTKWTWKNDGFGERGLLPDEEGTLLCSGQGPVSREVAQALLTRWLGSCPRTSGLYCLGHGGYAHGKVDPSQAALDWLVRRGRVYGLRSSSWHVPVAAEYEAYAVECVTAGLADWSDWRGTGPDGGPSHDMISLASTALAAPVVAWLATAGISDTNLFVDAVGIHVRRSRLVQEVEYVLLPWYDKRCRCSERRTDDQLWKALAPWDGSIPPQRPVRQATCPNCRAERVPRGAFFAPCSSCGFTGGTA